MAKELKILFHIATVSLAIKNLHIWETSMDVLITAAYVRWFKSNSELKRN